MRTGFKPCWPSCRTGEDANAPDQTPRLVRAPSPSISGLAPHPDQLRRSYLKMSPLVVASLLSTRSRGRDVPASGSRQQYHVGLPHPNGLGPGSSATQGVTEIVGHDAHDVFPGWRNLRRVDREPRRASRDEATRPQEESDGQREGHDCPADGTPIPRGSRHVVVPSSGRRRLSVAELLVDDFREGLDRLRNLSGVRSSGLRKRRTPPAPASDDASGLLDEKTSGEVALVDG